MRSSLRSIAAHFIIAALILTISPVSAKGMGGGATLEGRLVDVDGTSAAGYHVRLIDETGTAVARATADEDGRYSVSGVPAGEYRLCVENDRGQLAPVAAPPLRLGNDELARRDLKLLSDGDPESAGEAEGDSPSGGWWGGLSTGAKVWMVVAIVVAVGVTADALNDDEASPYQPADQ